MRNVQTITIHGFDSHSLCYLEALGMSKIFEAYAEIGEQIEDGGIGFNPNTGYVYISLENGISICSMLGQEVVYLVTNFDTGEDTFFDNYKDADKLIRQIYDYL